MADNSLTHDDCMDDSDEGFEQGDCPVGTPEDDASLPPLLRVQKYAQSTNVFHRSQTADCCFFSGSYLISRIDNRYDICFGDYLKP
ncbi:hypothetical protein JTB14_005940 [Gonioctena quinquepunctata]|nr:hypothetical protein JTB14_005940 [Gonioctena quinquepunctata]